MVVGAGIAGLAAALDVLRQRPNTRVTLLEAAPQTGGKLRVGELAGQHVDLGAEAMLNRRHEAVQLAREVGLADQLVYPLTTSAGVWSRGGVRPLPRTVMGVPADLAGLAASGILSRRAMPRARLERRLRRLDVTEDVAVGAVVAQRLGPEVRDRLVEPLLGGVYAGRADEISLHAAVPQLVPAIAANGGLLSAAAAIASPIGPADEPVAPVFAGIAGGVGRLAQGTEAAARAAGATIRCGATVRKITRTPDGFQILVGPTIAPELIGADAVIVATPAIAATRLLREISARAAVELSRIDYASMAVVTIAMRAAETVGDLTGSGFLVPPVDGHKIKAATYSTAKWGWLSNDLVVIRVSIGRYGDEALLQRPDSELVDAAVMDLREAIGLRGRLADALVTRWGGALPQYTVGHLDRVRRIREAVSLVPGVAVCGAAYDGLGIPACIANGQQAATQVVAHLRAQETMQHDDIRT